MVKVTLIDLNDCQAGNCLHMKLSLSRPDLPGSQARPATCPGQDRLSGKPARTDDNTTIPDGHERLSSGRTGA